MHASFNPGRSSVTNQTITTLLALSEIQCFLEITPNQFQSKQMNGNPNFFLFVNLEGFGVPALTFGSFIYLLYKLNYCRL